MKNHRFVSELKQQNKIIETLLVTLLVCSGLSLNCPFFFHILSEENNLKRTKNRLKPLTFSKCRLLRVAYNMKHHTFVRAAKGKTSKQKPKNYISVTVHL